MTSPQRIVAVVPCFNEEERLQTDAFLEACLMPELSVIFVDDGSTDGTRQLLQRIVLATSGKASLVVLQPNRGKAEAVRHGLLSALDSGADLVAYLDADLATPFSELIRIAGRLEAPQVRVAMGSRVALLGSRITRSAFRHYMGRVFATAAAIALDLQVYDTQCGAKVFRADQTLKRVLTKPFSSRWAFDVELLGRLRNEGCAPEAMVEVPLKEWEDVRGSKLKPAGMIRAAGEVARIGWRTRREARRRGR